MIVLIVALFGLAVFVFWWLLDECLWKADREIRPFRFKNGKVPKYYGPPSMQFYEMIFDRICDFFTKK